MPTSLRMTSAACLVAATLVAAGCGRHLSNSLGLPNRPPAVHLSGAAPASAGESRVSHRLSWTGSDPDGCVDHYLVATNPRSVDRVDESWQAVRETEKTLTLRRAVPGALQRDAGDDGELEVFAVRAVDDRGAISDPVWRAMFGDNVAPNVRIVSPQPNPLVAAFVPPTIRITWQGNDPDGPAPSKLARYKFKLLAEGNSEFPINLALANPDSLRRFYAPAFATWDSVPGDSLGHTFAGLEISKEYLFVITGFDVAGDYDPVFSLSTNMLRLRVQDPSTGGPRITLYNEYFSYTYPSGGFYTDPSREVPVQAPAGQPFTVHWTALPAVGADVAAYRWALDIVDVNDQSPRRGEKHDLEHWSEWSATTTSATVGPLREPAASQTHRLYVEALDSSGFISLGIVRFTPFAPAFDKDLLIVDDTRLQPDQAVRGRPDSIAAPVGAWPTAAELDTFLFARGGARWRMYPPGTLSRSGVFAGYRYDTLGTRTGAPDIGVPLSVLSRYRYVVWLVDGKGALNNGVPYDPTRPQCALRWMTRPGVIENPLAAYVKAGGRLWLLGGGAGYAATVSRDRPMNGGGVFSSALGELAPGAIIFDVVHWRSEFKNVSSVLPGLVNIAPSPVLAAYDDRVRAGANGEIGDGEDEDRDDGAAPGIHYGLLPAALQMRSAATDPVPPLRSPNGFYVQTTVLEYLSMPNEIAEHRNHSGTHGRRFSVLDSLYRADGPDLPPAPAVNACMTLYRGRENGQAIFSGFDIWSWQRTQCVQLVDGVLQGVWGLPRDPVARDGAARQPVSLGRGGDR